MEVSPTGTAVQQRKLRAAGAEPGPLTPSSEPGRYRVPSGCCQGTKQSLENERWICEIHTPLSLQTADFKGGLAAKL